MEAKAQMKKERDEAREQCKRADYDAAKETIKNSILKSHWLSVCSERDEWRECAEGLAFIVKNSAADYSILRDREAALAEFERLKEASK
jgi:hypothetical protein